MLRTLCVLLAGLPSVCLLAEAPLEGFTSLVASDSMQGWRGGVEDWKVVDGELIGTADGTLKANRFIVADIDPVKNFELQVEVWISDGGNSGLQYRSTERPDMGPFVVTGYQCDVVSNRAEYNGMLYEERGRRILAHTGERVVIDTDSQPWITASETPPTFAPESWHRYRVLVEGNHHRHWIDDVLTVDVVDLDVANRSLEGVLGVQVHVGPPMTIRYRNFFLKRLPDDLPLVTASEASIPEDAVPVEPQGGWKKQPKPTRKTSIKPASLEPAPIGATSPAFRHGNIWLAGQPSQSDFELLKSKGIKTVVTLRPDVELTWSEKDVVTGLGFEYVSIPIASANGFTDEKLDQTRELLRCATNESGVLLHCASAARVGTCWIAFRVLDMGLSIEAAQAEAAILGLKSPLMIGKATEYIQRKQAAK